MFSGLTLKKNVDLFYQRMLNYQQMVIGQASHMNVSLKTPCLYDGGEIGSTGIESTKR